MREGEQDRGEREREREIAVGAGQQENSIKMSPMLKRNLLELGSCEGWSSKYYKFNIHIELNFKFNLDSKL